MSKENKAIAAAESYDVGDEIRYDIIIKQGVNQVLMTANKPFVVPNIKDNFQTQGTVPSLSGVVEKVNTITTYNSNPATPSIKCTTYITLR